MFKLALLLALLIQESESLLEKLEREITGVVQKVRPSVVAVDARFDLDEEFSHTLSLSGIIYRRDGYIVTEATGVSEAKEIRVTLFDGKIAKATFVGSDGKTGIAILKIDAKDLSAIPLNTSALRPGVFAIAVGNAYGMRGSATIGTLSGTDRAIRVNGRKFENMLQLTTPANPGDCGGLVADSRGRLIGVVHSTYAIEDEFSLFGKDLWTTGQATITFAIPAETVEFVADRIIKHKKMVRGWIGCTARPADAGAEIVKIEVASPARKAGLRRGDVIVSFDGEDVKDVAALQKKIERCEEPKTVKLVYRRNGTDTEIEVRIEIP